RLPPYLFAKINKLKYEKRVAGIDVIDLGMGNPTDPPDPIVSEKLAEAVRDPRNHRYSVSTGIANLRKEVSARYWKRYDVRLDPTTTSIEQDFFVELVRLAKKYEFLVISDFAYADICYDGYQAPSFLATPGAIDVGVEFTTMSKSYSMAGWRIGFCSGNSEMV